MRIEIEKQIDAETKEVWTFNMFDLKAVFIAWSKQVKPKGKRKWTVEAYWDKYSHPRDYRTMEQEPVLTEEIKADALAEAIKHVRVITWGEFKK